MIHLQPSLLLALSVLLQECNLARFADLIQTNIEHVKSYRINPETNT